MPFKNPHPLYGVWQSMRRRCLTPTTRHWQDYGGRGVSICHEWDDFNRFVADMGPRPDSTSIDRIDNDGNYTPENCRWATRQEQQRNQRRAVFVLVRGVRYRAIELADLCGVKTDTIIERAAKGLPYEQVISASRLPTDYSASIAAAAKAAAAQKRSSTHCKHGHEFTPDNTYITKEGWRNCRACHRAKVLRQTRAKSQRKE